MPILENPRHERFAQALAAGKTADEAYATAGFKPNRGNASTLKANQSILDRVTELQGRVAEGVVLTRQWVIERLIENAERALQSRPVMDSEGKETGEYRYEGSVANRALELLGKEQGMFVERVNTNLTVTEPVDRPPRETYEQWNDRRRNQISGANGSGLVSPARPTNGSHHG